MGGFFWKKKNNKEDTKQPHQYIEKEKDKTKIKSTMKENIGKKDEENLSKYLKDKIELNSSIYYQVKSIENEYIKLESEIQQVSLDKNCDDDDDGENKIEIFLKKLKSIAKNALNLAQKIKRALFQEFKKTNRSFNNFIINKENQVDKGCLNEFSSWCKNNLKDEDQLVHDFCQKYNGEKYINEDFDFFKKLTKIYLECELCNEIIEYKTCDNECNFNPKQMYDLAEVRGVNKKVKYYVLPGLFYNGDFFQNGKIHVFAYSVKGK